MLALLALALTGPPLHEARFQVAQSSEVIAVLKAECERCSWGRKGREAAVLSLSVDGRYSQHLFLVQGERPAEYRVSLGAQTPGAHRLTITLDREASSPGVRGVRVERVEFVVSPEGFGEHMALSLAPVLHARPDTVGHYTDVPLLMWYETEPTPRGTRIRYSVVFSGEDGGTPADRLMATWGRLTDIESVYGVEVDASGRILGEEYQGPDHKMLPFAGKREGRHPLLWVATENNMLSDQGATTQRYAPAPLGFGLMGVSREAVMDAHPWTYRVMIQEAGREGRLVRDARPGSKRIPDPRRFAYLEACGELQGATLSFAVGFSRRDGRVKWSESDGGRQDFRIARSGCFRGAVSLPSKTRAGSLKALRFRAFTRQREKDEPPLPSGAGVARLTRVNRLFLLEPDGAPGPNLFTWTGEASLKPGEAALTLPIEIEAAP